MPQPLILVLKDEQKFAGQKRKMYHSERKACEEVDRLVCLELRAVLQGRTVRSWREGVVCLQILPGVLWASE